TRCAGARTARRERRHWLQVVQYLLVVAERESDVRMLDQQLLVARALATDAKRVAHLRERGLCVGEATALAQRACMRQCGIPSLRAGRTRAVPQQVQQAFQAI